MEPQTPNTTSIQQDRPRDPFEVGAHVIYALHGKCKILGIENRSISGTSVPFYKLEPVKSNLSRSTKQEPHIWLPVASAKDRGMRAPMTEATAEICLKTITSREYYFSIHETWGSIQPKLESAFRNEGAVGLAKVISYLHVLKRRETILSTEAAKLQDAVHKTLVRELSEVLKKPVRTIEEQIVRGLRHKLIPDS